MQTTASPVNFQDTNSDVASAVAVSVTVAPRAIGMAQSVVQSMPAGDDTTRPLPRPYFATMAMYIGGGGGLGANRAVTVRSRSIVSVHAVFVPHSGAFSQPMKSCSNAGTALSVICSPSP